LGCETGELRKFGKTCDAGEGKSRDATTDTQIAPPNCDWREYWRSGQPDGGEPDRKS
jgi:hypothetical protein